jgi:hypothetical protein
VERKVIIGLAIATILVGGAAGPASADTPGCVTRAEFRKASKGMKMTRVHDIFDTRGRRVDYLPGDNGFPAEQVRVYRPCNPNVTQINAGYRKRSAGVWRLAFKNWFS